MKKNDIRNCTILAIILIVFSVITFCVPFHRTRVLIVGYIFGVIAIFAQLYFFKIAFSSEKNVKSKFYGLPIARVGMVYLVVQLVISFLEFMFAAPIPLWIAIVINVIVLAAAFIGSMGTDFVKNEIVRQDTVLKKSVSSMRELQSLANAIMNYCDEDSIKEKLGEITEEFKFSDPVSSESTVSIENEMYGQLEEIQNAIEDGDTSDVKSMSERLLLNLRERNRLCKLNKNS